MPDNYRVGGRGMEAQTVDWGEGGGQWVEYVCVWVCGCVFACVCLSVVIEGGR